MSVAIDPQAESIAIPSWVHDLPSFQRWVHSGEIPEKLKVHFINDHIWIDYSMEETFSHNQVKATLNEILRSLIRTNGLGKYFPDGMRYTSETADFSTEPDCIFVSNKTFERKEVEFRSGEKGEATELVGTPDLVIEVVSRNSVEKDTEWLLEKYHEAGIPEYWLIDARNAEIQFDIFRHTPKSYQATKRSAGWLKSNVLGKSFKLTRTIDRFKMAEYQLEVR
jgi:Uma2 family endonuclease